MAAPLAHVAALDVRPLLPAWSLEALAALCVAAGAVSLWRGGGGTAWRAAFFALALGWLTGPVLLQQDWRMLPETLLLVVDRTGSMQVGNRSAMVDAAAARIQAEAARLPGIQVRTVPVEPADAPPGGGTRLAAAIGRAAAAVPEAAGGSRIAAVVALTDGQAHDMPAGIGAGFPPGNRDVPLHVLIPAAAEQQDRRLRVLQAPPFGIVGRNATLRVQVDDLGVPAGDAGGVATLTLKRDGDAPETRSVAVGQPQDITVPVDRPGPMLVSLAVSARPGEVSDLDNRAVVRIEGVRDRLRVLLVSGTPNQGERVWRRLLKADPSVDLVHFTILRPPDKDDSTPLNELALIAFPVRELFQDKINQFDLIILDGFENRGILPMSYLRNIADFVRGGGGLLVTAGPEFVGPGTLQDTPLGDVLPVRVPEEGGLVEQRFQPMPTPLGRRHPVTGGLPDLPPPAGGTGGWGVWYRALRADPARLAPGAEVLMSGPAGSPLLVLDRVGSGRIALLLSDQIWLWSRGEAGGGPQAELLRRLAHWLMKEPGLEEEQLSAVLDNGRLAVSRRSVATDPARTVTVVAPDGRRTPLALRAEADGIARGTAEATAPGIWEIQDGSGRAFAAAMPADPLELSDLRATATVLAPLARATGGGIGWLGTSATDPAVPALRLVDPGADAAGRGWIGLRRHGAHAIAAERAVPLLPAWAVLPALLLLLLLGWRAEGSAATRRRRG